MQKIVDWFFPKYCIVCGFIAVDFFCEDCLSELPWISNACLTCAEALPAESLSKCGECFIDPPPIDVCIVLFNYCPPLSSLITQLKFHNKILFASPLGELLAKRIKANYQALNIHLPDCILPMPLFSKRLRTRGYNQSMEVARPIKKMLKIPINYKLVKRKKDTAPQTLLSRQQRQSNVKDAFIIEKETHIHHVAIVDDVVTTFSTLFEIAKTLKKAGIEKVDAWCLAKAK